MASDKSPTNATVIFPEVPGTSKYITAEVPVGPLNKEIFDLAFTTAVGCSQYTSGGCEGMRQDHRFGSAVQLAENWKYKYLVDVDGMGYSARFMAFLASESAVIKSTIYKEFYSDWIQPWYETFFFSSSLMFPCRQLILCLSILGSISSHSRSRTLKYITFMHSFPDQRHP